MNTPSTRIRKRRAPQRPLPDPHQTPLVSRRRSSRIESRQRSVSIPHILGSYYESQSPLEQRQTDPQTSQPLRATSYTRVPTSGPVEASAPVPSRAQVQEYLGPPQTNNYQSRKRRPDRSIDTGAERPPKRARLTKENLKTFEKMGGQGRKSGKEPKSNSSQSRKSSRSEAKTKSSATTESSSKTVSTTDSSFPRLVFENGVLDPLNSAPPENLGYLQDRLNRARDTESPTESEYQDFVYRT
ncbi:hypothetical protein BJ875DRAFT_54489 [Amylocarpus encephaloides]|uniref:Uncharacterized protein n=1 Tax=Amylocarpus encephaloides TaxID=45428 RepID=A0A9P7YGP5_9HELO|nr:hypothetical protein BJ875DRAFT_54489 [Amylocarpus encephaloides]